MKKAAQMAWGAMGGLIGLAVVLIGVGWWYHVSMFWAGGMLCAGQAVVMGLAAWGLSLARQAAELNEASAVPVQVQTPAQSGFRMSPESAEDSGRSAGADGRGGVGAGGVAGGIVGSVVGHAVGGHLGGMVGRALGRAVGAKSSDGGSGSVGDMEMLDTTYQRTLVFISGVVLAVLSGLTFWMVMGVYRWSQAHPDMKVPIAGTLESVGNLKLWQAFDEYALLAGLAAGAGYVIFYWLTRPSRRTGAHGMAASSNFTLGVTGMAALGVGSVLAYFKVVWVSEMAAGLIAALMLLQGLELIVNAFRSYSSIEEMDQDAVDLQATPLGPMLSSSWLGGVRMLLAQSVGLSGGKKGGGERGVIARMMPRALAALGVMAIVMSCFRVVPPGKVAVLERLGYTPLDAEGRPTEAGILQPGLHVMMPWPVDRLVYIPTRELQLVDVGKELHAPDDWKNVDFQFWMIRPPSNDALTEEARDLYITADPGSPQVLETFVQVRWRVADPARFYSAMSHSEYFQAEGEGTQELPIYEALVQQATSYAVTKTFGIHTMEQVLVSDRSEAEEHCREILQEKLDSLCRLPGEAPGASSRGIEVAYLTIKDLHPPYGGPDKYDPNKPAVGGMLTEVNGQYELVNDPRRPSTIDRGPASAFELLVTMREFEQEVISTAKGEAIKAKNEGHGQAESMVADAQAYASQRVAQAHGDADRFVEMTRGMSQADLNLMERRLLFDTAKDLLDPVFKVVVDPKVSDVVIIQNTDKGGVGTFAPPPGQ